MQKKYLWIGVVCLTGILVIAGYGFYQNKIHSGGGFLPSIRKNSEKDEKKEEVLKPGKQETGSGDQRIILTKKDYEELIACIDRELQSLGYVVQEEDLPGDMTIINEKVEMPAQAGENRSAREIKELAKSLSISEEELNRLIAESRTYTDEVYQELAEEINVSYEELKILIEKNIKNDDLENVADKLGISDEKLYAAIAATKELTDADIEALARKLNMDVADLDTIFKSSIKKIEKNLSDSVSELNTAISANRQEAEASLENAMDILLDNISDNKALTDADIENLIKALAELSDQLKYLNSRAVQKEIYDAESNTLYLTVG